jgi:PBP1b-binding outer membrane lipoprotein LpoB
MQTDSKLAQYQTGTLLSKQTLIQPNSMLTTKVNTTEKKNSSSNHSSCSTTPILNVPKMNIAGVFEN